MQGTRAKELNGAIAPTQLIKDKNLSPAQKVVWLAIRDREGKNENAWPSLQTIAKDSALSRRTVVSAIHGVRRCGKWIPGLEQLGWLNVEVSNDRIESNRYECWVPPSVKSAPPARVVKKVHRGGVKSAPDGGVKSAPEPTQLEPTQEPTHSAPPSAASVDSAGVQEILKVFYDTINPNVPFGHKTQRDAASTLIKQFGLEKAIRVTKYAVSVQGDKFAPIITTPRQLVNNLARLMVYGERKKSAPPLVAHL